VESGFQGANVFESPVQAHASTSLSQTDSSQ
jgi:hypothetical protein